jgi:transcriptional regulator with XRE-family HTH domain
MGLQHLDQYVRRRISTHLAAMPVRPTQEAIGEAIGHTQTWVSHYLNGRHDADLTTLHQLCDYIGLRLADILAEAAGEAPAKPDNPEESETLTLLRSITPAERRAQLEILRIIARRPSTKRARQRRNGRR